MLVFAIMGLLGWFVLSGWAGWEFYAGWKDVRHQEIGIVTFAALCAVFAAILLVSGLGVYSCFASAFSPHGR